MANPSLNEVLSKANATTRALNAHLVPVPDFSGCPGAFPQHAPVSGLQKAIQDEMRRPRKCLVRVTSYRRRLLDTDNLVVKWHIDALRYAGVLHSDAPEQTLIETSQVKVRLKRSERTEITIESPER